MAAPLCTVVRDNRGQISTDKAAIREKRDNVRRKRVKQNNFLEHKYSIGHIDDDVCNFNGCEDCCPGYWRLLNSKKIQTEEWKKGRRVIEWRCLIDSLSHCLVCKMGHMKTWKVKWRWGWEGICIFSAATAVSWITSHTAVHTPNHQQEDRKYSQWTQSWVQVIS